MIDKTFAPLTLGLELTKNSLKGALLQFSAGRVSLERTFEITVEAPESKESHVKLLYMKEDEKEFISALQRTLTVTALNTSNVLIRSLKLALKKLKAVDQVLEFETEPLLPFAIDQAIYDRLVLSQTDEGTELSILATKKQEVLHHLEKTEEISIEPEVISCTPFALACFAKFFIPSNESLIVLNIGYDETTISLVGNGKVYAAYSSPYCLSQLLEIFGRKDKDKFTQLDFSKINEGSLKKSIENLSLEVKKLLYSLGKHPKAEGIKHLLVTGDVVLLKGLIAFESLKKVVEIDETLILNASKETLCKYAISVGLALSCLPNAQEQINFRQKEFAYPNPFKRLIKPIGLYFALAILAACALGIFGGIYVQSKEANIKEKYLELLAQTGKTAEQFENEWKEKYPKSPKKTPEELTQSDLFNRIQFMEDKIKTTPAVYPLFPNVPKVSDVLAWLSNHPLIIAEKGEEPKIKLDSINYKMVKYPEQTRPQEKYQVRVELEFTAATPRAARELHDALLTPNDFIDPNFEIKWSSDREKYRTSFMLKDKTGYPIMR